MQDLDDVGYEDGIRGGGAVEFDILARFVLHWVEICDLEAVVLVLVLAFPYSKKMGGNGNLPELSACFTKYLKFLTEVSLLAGIFDQSSSK